MESVLVYSGHIENAVKLKLDKPSDRQIDKISILSDFEFNSKGVIVRMASGIGKGKQIDLKPVHQPARYKCVIHLPTSNELIPVDSIQSIKINSKFCLPTKLTPRLMKFQDDVETASIAMDQDQVHPEELLEDGGFQDSNIEEVIQKQGSLYTCPTNGCVCVFKSIERYRQHVRDRIHKIRLRKRSARRELKYK